MKLEYIVKALLVLNLFISRSCLALITQKFKTKKLDVVKTRKFRKSSLHLSLPGFPLPIIQSGLAVAAVVAFHEAGHFLAARLQGMKISSFNIGYGPKLISFNDSTNTEFALRAFPLGGFVAFPANVEYNEDTGEVIKELDDPDLLQNRPPWQRAIVISAGVIANFLLAFLLSSGVSYTSGISRPIFSEGVVVTKADDTSSPAYLSGIRKSDVITKINRNVIEASETSVQDFISKIRTNADTPVELEYNRNGKILTTVVIPRTAAGAGAGLNNNKASIGIGINLNIVSYQTFKAENVLQAAEYGAEETGRITSTTIDGLKNLLTNGLGSGDIGGPISVVKVGAELAQVSDTALFGFMAALSVNLAVLNSLPLPALDGGQLVFVLGEIVTRKKIPRTIQEKVTAAAFAFLFVLSASALLNDISKINEPVGGIVSINRNSLPPNK